MTITSMIIKSAAEIAVIILLIVGFINESKLVKFERKAFRVVAAVIRARAKKRELERQRAAAEQRHEAEYAAHRKSEPLPEKIYEHRGRRHSPRKVA
ncbi:MAG: hypothetical protein GX107_00570 [Clostridiales bacterium]|jgi:hypothetical protein|nr:hypothetical protein [Clostridiales bacterium]